MEGADTEEEEDGVADEDVQEVKEKVKHEHVVVVEEDKEEHQ